MTTTNHFDQLSALVSSRNLIIEYHNIRSQMIHITKQIKSTMPYDTDPQPDCCYDKSEILFSSSHYHDYFVYDKEARGTEDGGLEFSEYCMDVLGMDVECPECSTIIEMIRKRRSLNKKLGIVKCKIMRLGKQISDQNNTQPKSTVDNITTL